MDENKCENCVHYMPHYIKRKMWLQTAGGHCMSRKPSGHSRKTDKICECFKLLDKEEFKVQQKMDLTETLSLIAQRLSDICLIIKEQD